MNDIQQQYEVLYEKAKLQFSSLPEGKQKSIAEITLQQTDLIVKGAIEAVRYAASLKKKPRIVKRGKKKMSPLGFFLTALKLRTLEQQKHVIASQPIPKFRSGGIITSSQDELVLNQRSQIRDHRSN